jgi:hypothetical protein
MGFKCHMGQPKIKMQEQIEFSLFYMDETFPYNLSPKGQWQPK